MEHDIRNLFDKNELPKKELPKFHREEFIEKLNQSEEKKPKRKSFLFLKIASSIALIISLGYYYLENTSETEIIAKTQIQLQVEKVEKEYLINIDKEWKNFVEVTNDTILIKKYEEKLKEFDLDYNKISFQFKENPNNINVLESLIYNLQRRLQLIKDIKEHVKELNQKNTSNETIYL